MAQSHQEVVNIEDVDGRKRIDESTYASIESRPRFRRYLEQLSRQMGRETERYRELGERRYGAWELEDMPEHSPSGRIVSLRDLSGLTCTPRSLSAE